MLMTEGSVVRSFSEAWLHWVEKLQTRTVSADAEKRWAGRRNGGLASERA